MPLAIFCDCTARFVSDLVGNPEEWFSHNEAHFVCIDVGTCETEQNVKPDSKVIKPFLCSTQPSLKFILLINVKMPTIVGILTFISRINVCH